MPVIFGPNYKKFREAKDMIENSGALSVSNLNDLSMSISKLKDQNTLLQMGANNKQYIDSQKGGSKLILNRLKELSIY